MFRVKLSAVEEEGSAGFCFVQIEHPFTKAKTRFPCPNCTSSFGQKASLTRHLKYECRQEPRFLCPYCQHRSKKTSDIYTHIRRKHANSKVYVIDIHGTPPNSLSFQMMNQ